MKVIDRITLINENYNCRDCVHLRWLTRNKRPCALCEIKTNTVIFMNIIVNGNRLIKNEKQLKGCMDIEPK